MLKMDSKTYLILAAALVVGIVIGYFVGISTQNKVFQLGLQKGMAEVEQKYQIKIAKLFPPAPEPKEIFSISGKIKKIEGKTLVGEEKIYSVNPFEDPKVKQWKVNVTDVTELVKRIEKTPEEIMQERELLGSGEALSSFKQIRTDFSDFKVDKEVIAESESNIKGKAEFEARVVILLP